MNEEKGPALGGGLAPCPFCGFPALVVAHAGGARGYSAACGNWYRCGCTLGMDLALEAPGGAAGRARAVPHGGGRAGGVERAPGHGGTEGKVRRWRRRPR